MAEAAAKRVKTDGVKADTDYERADVYAWHASVCGKERDPFTFCRGTKAFIYDIKTEMIEKMSLKDITLFAKRAGITVPATAVTLDAIKMSCFYGHQDDIPLRHFEQVYEEKKNKNAISSKKRAETLAAKKAANPEQYKTKAEREAEHQAKKVERTKACAERLLELWDVGSKSWKSGHQPLIEVDDSPDEIWFGFVQYMDVNDRTLFVTEVEFDGSRPDETEVPVDGYAPSMYELIKKRVVVMDEDLFTMMVESCVFKQQ